MNDYFFGITEFIIYVVVFLVISYIVTKFNIISNKSEGVALASLWPITLPALICLATLFIPCILLFLFIDWFTKTLDKFINGDNHD